MAADKLKEKYLLMQGAINNSTDSMKEMFYDYSREVDKFVELHKVADKIANDKLEEAISDILSKGFNHFEGAYLADVQGFMGQVKKFVKMSDVVAELEHLDARKKELMEAHGLIQEDE